MVLRHLRSASEKRVGKCTRPRTRAPLTTARPSRPYACLPLNASTRQTASKFLLDASSLAPPVTLSHRAQPSMGLLGLVSASLRCVSSKSRAQLDRLPAISPKLISHPPFLVASRSNVSGFIYPCYASYKALSNKDNIQLERWLTYWCVVGTWTGVEGATSWVLAWVPFYSEIKLLAVLWMVAPQTEVRSRSSLWSCFEGGMLMCSSTVG